MFPVYYRILPENKNFSFQINIPHYHNQWWNSCAYSLRITMPCNITQISFDIDSRFIQKEDPWNYIITLSGNSSQNFEFLPKFQKRNHFIKIEFIKIFLKFFEKKNHFIKIEFLKIFLKFLGIFLKFFRIF